MHETEQEPRNRRDDPARSKSGMWAVGLLALPALYVLSIGPAAWIIFGLTAFHKMVEGDDFHSLARRAGKITSYQHDAQASDTVNNFVKRYNLCDG